MELPLNHISKTLFLDRFYIKARQSLNMLLLPLDYLRDFATYLLHCRLSPLTQRNEKDGYDLIFFAHTIEKGLSLPNPRTHFGRNNVARILHLLRVCDKEKTNPAAIQMGFGVLDEYIEFHRSIGEEDSYIKEIVEQCRRLRETRAFHGIGGTKNVAEVNSSIGARSYSYSEFIESRYSCRNFADKPVELSEVEDAVRIAQAAPSQCNRQSTRLYCYSSKDKIRTLLSLQGGSRGFAEDVPCLLVVTNELSAWTGNNERNQCYVDGALFAMCLLLAFHSKQIGACSLNFAKTNSQERRFRKLAGVPAGERIIMLIAVGYQSSEKTVAARSVRAPLEYVLNKM